MITKLSNHPIKKLLVNWNQISIPGIKACHCNFDNSGWSISPTLLYAKTIPTTAIPDVHLKSGGNPRLD